MTRIVIRMKLVANVVLAYLNLKDYREAYFWGDRTLNIIRMHTDGLVNYNIGAFEFPARNELGKIFYRTGCAAKELGDVDTARMLFRAALLYFPNDASVQAAVASVALKLG